MNRHNRTKVLITPFCLHVKTADIVYFVNRYSEATFLCMTVRWYLKSKISSQLYFANKKRKKPFRMDGLEMDFNLLLTNTTTFKSDPID